MEENGWIKISRDITSHWVWQDANRLKWWLDILMMANWDDNEVVVGMRRITIKRGQMIASLSFLQQRWNIAKNTLLRFLRMLEDDGMITRETSGNITMLSVCQYDRYQFGQINNQLNNQKNKLNDSESRGLQDADGTPTEQPSEHAAEPPLTRQLNHQLNHFNSSESISYASENASSMNNQLNPNKEYIYSCSCYSACAHTREEEFFAEIRKNRSWQEQGVCMKHHITIEECLNYINEFEIDCKARNTSHNDMREVYNHFANWIIIRLRIKKDDNNRKDKRSNNAGADDKRRGIEVTATSAEDYTTTF